MTKTRIAAVALAVSFLGTAACFSDNAHVGTWKVNHEKSKMAPGMGKTNTVMYAEKKDEIQVTINGTDKGGKPTHGVWKGKADGQVYKVKGNLAWDAMTYRTLNDRTYVMTAMKDGKMTWRGKSSVAKDGKSRTLYMDGTGPDGKKFKAKIVYDKE